MYEKYNVGSGDEREWAGPDRRRKLCKPTKKTWANPEVEGNRAVQMWLCKKQKKLVCEIK